MSARLKIIQAGPSVSVQDAGRPGHLRYGVSTSGVMDKTSYLLGNAALGNKVTLPAIEVSLGGLSIRCLEGSVAVAVVGGNFNVKLNDMTLPHWCMLSLNPEDTLNIRPGAWGSWCYVCFAESLDTPVWLGSQSVHLKSGVCGAALSTNDILTLKASGSTGHAVSEHHQSNNNSNATSLGEPNALKPNSAIRVVLGPQNRFFNDETVQKLFNKTFTISADYDRMGMRLNGCSLPVDARLDMPSEPITRGSLQVPGHGDPIVLMADHHTAGGYPKIATVISADLDALAQHRSGDTLTFTQTTTAAAVDAARLHKQHCDQLQDKIMLNAVGITNRLWSSNLISGALSGLEKDQ